MQKHILEDEYAQETTTTTKRLHENTNTIKGIRDTAQDVTSWENVKKLSYKYEISDLRGGTSGHVDAASEVTSEGREKS